MKKIIFPTLILLLISFISVFAQDTTQEQYIYGDWEAVPNKSGLTLTVYNGSDPEPEIPSIIDEIPVTALGKGIFKNNFALEKIVIPNSVTSIGAEAFFGCSSLKYVKLPESLQKIESHLFHYCISLENIEIPFSLTSIGSFAFADCIELKEIGLLSVTSIGESAFDNCPMLTSISLSGKLTTLGTHAFTGTAWLDNQTDEFVTVGRGILIKWNGSKADVEIPLGTVSVVDAFEGQYIIESVLLPETVTQIGVNAFTDAVNLRTINIPENVTSIGNNAFMNCRSLEAIDLPDGLLTIGASAFKNCTGLRTFTFPQQITTIGNSVLAGCSELTNIIISRAVTKIDATAFQNCTEAVLNVPFDSFAEQFAVEKGLSYAHSLQEYDGFIYRPEENGISILQYKGNVYDVEIPAVIDGLQVKAVETAAFQNNSTVRSISIPMTVKTIGDWAFSYMDSLESVQFPAGLANIGSYLFTGSPALKEIRIPRGLSQIGTEFIDDGAQTVICADEDSAAAGILQEMGYEIQPNDQCAEDPAETALREELAKLGILTDGSDCNCSGPLSESEEITVIRIPDGIAELSADLLGDLRGSVMLVIPADVTKIEEQIIEGRELTIVSGSGTAAETFAKEHGTKFLVMLDTLLNIQ